MRSKAILLLLAAACHLAPSGASAQIQTEAIAGESNVAAKNPAAEDRGFLVKVESKPIPFKTRYELSRSVGAGRIVKKQAGKPGSYTATYRIQMEGERVVSKEKVETVRTEPVDEVYHVGRSGYAASRGHFERGKVLTMTATAYDPSAGRGRFATGRTKMGIPARYGVVAVDPRVIPLGTMVFVEGYGIAYACDVGSAIKGNKIDLCFPTAAQCRQFGRRKVVVHILK